MTLFHLISDYFLIFCRIGACLTLAPGFSSDRVPLLSRLYLSLAIAFTIGPIIDNQDFHSLTLNSPVRLTSLITHELIVGLYYGFVCRLFLFSIDSLITTICFTIGLTNIFSSELIDVDASPALSAFIILVATELIFITDLHHVFIQGAVQSYRGISLGSTLDLSSFIDGIINPLNESYLIVLRLSSPFLIFAIIVNLSFAFLSRLSPNYPIYFISGPFVISFCLYLFEIGSNEYLSSLIFSFRQLIMRA